MIDVMYVKCLTECLETITNVTNYEYNYYNSFYAWFKGNGPASGCSNIAVIPENTVVLSGITTPQNHV